MINPVFQVFCRSCHIMETFGRCYLIADGNPTRYICIHADSFFCGELILPQF